MYWTKASIPKTNPETPNMIYPYQVKWRYHVIQTRESREKLIMCFVKQTKHLAKACLFSTLCIMNGQKKATLSSWFCSFCDTKPATTYAALIISGNIKEVFSKGINLWILLIPEKGKWFMNIIDPRTHEPRIMQAWISWFFSFGFFHTCI